MEERGEWLSTWTDFFFPFFSSSSYRVVDLVFPLYARMYIIDDGKGKRGAIYPIRVPWEDIGGRDTLVTGTPYRRFIIIIFFFYFLIY